MSSIKIASNVEFRTFDLSNSENTIKINTPMQGVLCAIPSNVAIKDVDFSIELLSEKSKRNLIVPRMSLVSYLEFCQRITPLSQPVFLTLGDSGSYRAFVLLFSLSGSLDFSMNNEYNVTFYYKPEALAQGANIEETPPVPTILYSPYESIAKGYPILIRKTTFSVDDIETSVNVAEFDYILTTSKFKYVQYKGYNDKISTIPFSTIEIVQTILDYSVEINGDDRESVVFDVALYRDIVLKHDGDSKKEIYLIDSNSTNLSTALSSSMTSILTATYLGRTAEEWLQYFIDYSKNNSLQQFNLFYSEFLKQTRDIFTSNEVQPIVDLYDVLNNV